MKKCSVCGHDNPDDARYCAVCGEPFPEVEVKEEPGQIVYDGTGFCPLCQREVRTFMGRCEFCGEPILPRHQPSDVTMAVQQQTVSANQHSEVSGDTTTPASASAEDRVHAAPVKEERREPERLRVGEKRKNLEGQRECFVCLGTINDDQLYLCPKCGIAYHRKCAEEIGECPNCGQKFFDLTG